MTIETVYYVSQILAVVVIIGSLIAILFQAKQTNTVARANLTLASVLQTGATHYSFMDSPEKADFMYRALFGNEPLTSAEKIRFGNLMGYAIGMHEAAYLLRQRGLIEDAAYDRSEGLSRLYLQSARVRKWWQTRRDYSYDAAFRTIIDDIAAEYATAAEPPARTGKAAPPDSGAA
ncbi:MAG: hypothetical protein R3B98_03780 [Hyphomonas sp.]